MISFSAFKRCFWAASVLEAEGERPTGFSSHDVECLTLLMGPLITHHNPSGAAQSHLKCVLTCAMAACVCVWDKCDSFIS